MNADSKARANFLFTNSFRVVKVFGDYEIYLILSNECVKLRRTMVPALFGLKLRSLYLKSLKNAQNVFVGRGFSCDL